VPGSLIVVVSYFLLAVFVVAFLARTFKMARMPVHLRWELSPIPHEKGRSRYGGSYLEEFEWWTKPREKSLANEFAYMFLEIAFLKSVWEHNRRLWWFSFPLHFGMYLLIVAGLSFILWGILQWVELSGPGLEWVATVISVLAGAGYALGGVGALGLLASRLINPQFKPFTTPAMWFNLALLLAVFASGGYAIVASDYAVGVSDYLLAMFTANSSIELQSALAVHLALALLFLAYLPFTQMMHFVAKYFTYHQVRWNDEPLVPGGRMEKEVLELLKQPVTWSADHLRADGRKNWVDIVTEEAEK
jgi:nitrate reductase gamma subunit